MTPKDVIQAIEASRAGTVDRTHQDCGAAVLTTPAGQRFSIEVRELDPED